MAAYYFCIKTCFHRQPETRERTPGLAETGVALTTLNEDGHPRTIQFRVDSWEAERQNVQDVMDEVQQLRDIVQDLERRMSEMGPPRQDPPSEDYGGHQLRARTGRRN